MPNRTLASVAALVLAVSPGCMNLPKGTPASTCSPARQEGSTVRVKAPPQKIVIEQPEDCCPEEGACPEEGETKPTPKKKEEGRPQANPRPRPQAEERRPTPEAGAAQPQAGALGTLAALGQIASLSRTVAMTNPLGTVNPGASALGLGIRWIHIPFPLPRLFSVQETPSVTVPLSEANLTTAGYGGIGTGLVAGNTQVAAGHGLSREEIAALIARELASRRDQANRQETARCTPANDAERGRLEKKLAAAEAQIEKLSKVLKALDDKIPAKMPTAKDKDEDKE